MRRPAVIGILVSGMLLCAAAQPAAAAVDLLQRLVEKGILTEEERKELAKEQDVVSAHRGRGFSWATPDGRFRAELYGYGQVRYTFDDRDQGDNRSNFSVQRARLGLRGNAFLKDLKYQLFLNVYSGDQNAVSLFDWFADYTPLPQLGLRVGQSSWRSEGGRTTGAGRAVPRSGFARGRAAGQAPPYRWGFQGSPREQTQEDDPCDAFFLHC
jgi:hypothetical protein